MKKLLWFIGGSLATLILILILVGSPRNVLLLIFASEMTDRWVDRNLFVSDSDFTIAGQSYSMPDEMFNVSRNGLSVISYWIILPDFSQKRLASQEELKDAELKNNIGHLFIIPASKKFIDRDLRLVHYTNKNEVKIITRDSFDGLEHYEIFSIAGDGEIANISRTETYLYPSKDDIQELIRCYEAEVSKPRWCEHHFLNEGLLYKIRYRKTHLPEHNQIKNKLIAHIESYKN